MQLPPPRRIQREDLRLGSGASYVLREFRLPAFPLNWHCHPELELTLIVRGRGMRFVGDSIQPYADGDLCLLGENTPHTWSSIPAHGRVHSVVLQFRADIWGDRLLGLPEMRSVQALFERARRGLAIGGSTKEIIRAKLRALLQQPVLSPRRVSGLFDLLVTLAGHPADCKPLATTGDVPRLTRKVDQKLNVVLSFIHAHAGEALTQRQVAQVARMSPAAFSRFFKMQIGKTYVQYQNETRLGRACRELLDTDQNIAAIAFAAGFNNLSHFNRQFRRLHRITPLAYRQLARPGHVAAR